MSEYDDDPVLFKNCKTFHENMKDQRQKLMERMNRLESIVSLGKSYDRIKDERYYDSHLNDNYTYDEKLESSPTLMKYPTVSQAPTNRIRLNNHNTQSQKITKKSESKSKMYQTEKSPFVHKAESWKKIVPYKCNRIFDEQY